MNEVRRRASGRVQRAALKVATMIDEPGHPTGDLAIPRCKRYHHVEDNFRGSACRFRSRRARACRRCRPHHARACDQIRAGPSPSSPAFPSPPAFPPSSLAQALTRTPEKGGWLDLTAPAAILRILRISGSARAPCSPAAAGRRCFLDMAEVFSIAEMRIPIRAPTG